MSSAVHPNSPFVICTDVLCHGTSRLAIPTHLCHRWLLWWYCCQTWHLQVHRRPWWYLFLQPEHQRHYLLSIHHLERKRTFARRWATLFLFWHFNSCWTWLSHSLVILGTDVLVITWHKYTFRLLWCDAILSVVKPPYCHNIWYKSCCTFTVMMSGSTGSVSNTPKYLKSTFCWIWEDRRPCPSKNMHTAHRWIGARPNCLCWPSVKSTRKILSSSVTCLVLMSYCTSWWQFWSECIWDHRIQWSHCGDCLSIASPMCTESCMFNPAGTIWLDYKSCWQVSSCGRWYFYISAPTRLWSNTFR